jgi:hypothetical protein
MPEMTNTTPPEVQYAPPRDALSVAKLVASWLFVGIPLAWAVWQVFVKALALFHQ